MHCSTVEYQQFPEKQAFTNSKGLMMNSTYMNIPALLIPSFSKARAKAVALEANMTEEATAESTQTVAPKASSLWDAAAGLKFWGSKPAQPLSATEEAEEVRALARSVAETDPGFASDLFAAAARHESRE
jgi:hypothetical protein